MTTQLQVNRNEPRIVDFDDHLRWVEVSRLDVTPRGSISADAEVCLSGMISSAAYRDSFLERESWKRDSKSVHGPYRIEALSPKDFVPVPRTDFESRLAAWLDGGEGYDSGAPPDRRKSVRDLTAQIPVAAACYCLSRELDDAEHEFSFVLLDFTEFVFFDTEADCLWSVVWGAD
jgi:hypothetical protein